MSEKPLYYESHITIEPVFGERLQQFSDIVEQHGFKAAKLLMQKDREATPERSNKDTFCTGRGKRLINLDDRMMHCVTDLKDAGFAVWRYKIESVLVDVKLDRNS